MERTSAALRRTPGPYEEHRNYVLSVLARRCRWLDPSDREAIMHDAYAVFLEKQRDAKLDVTAMRPAQVRAYLTQTALNKAMDEGKRAGRRSLSLDDEQLGLDPQGPEPDLGEGLASRFDDARIREIVAELPERQQVVIKLRFFFGRTPHEIQRYLGVTERVYRRELERATRHIAEQFALVLQGDFCESRRSLILAYVAGIAGPTRAADARRHLDTCPACSHWAIEMRAATRRVAAVLPPALPVLPVAGGLLGRAAMAARGTRQRLADLAATARSHSAQALVHLDPSKAAALSAARPGTAAMLMAGCLAAGSTATYCIVQGVPAPIRSVVGESAPRRDHVRAAGSVTTKSDSGARPAAGIVSGTPSPRSGGMAPGVAPASTVRNSSPRTSENHIRSSSSHGSARSGSGRTQPSQRAANTEFGFERRATSAASPPSSTHSPTSRAPSSSGSASQFGFEKTGSTASSPSPSAQSPLGSGSRGSSSAERKTTLKTPAPKSSAARTEFGP